MDKANALDNEFELDLIITANLGPQTVRGCNTNDGCAPSCASSCISNV